jgi:Family of unknown function (DUF6516)
VSATRLRTTRSSNCASGGSRTRCTGRSTSSKYALAYVVKGTCVLRYDNEAGKGDHKHVGSIETGYRFTTPAQLLTDFWRDVDEWRPK